jgi:hypothetical protein
MPVVICWSSNDDSAKFLWEYGCAVVVYTRGAWSVCPKSEILPESIGVCHLLAGQDASGYRGRQVKETSSPLNRG